MKPDVATAIEELRRQFESAKVSVREDGQGGGFVVIDSVPIGARYQPSETWMGFHIPAQYPYADIYPAFIGAEVKRVDNVPFQAPITPNHKFEGRPALQISRRNTTAQTGLQKATTKVLKILTYLGSTP